MTAHSSHHPVPAASFPDRHDSDEASLYDVLLFLKEGRNWLVATALAGFLAGGAYALFAPPKFQAKASIQMTTVANEPVEALGILTEKLRSPAYYSPEILSACNILDAKFPGEYLVKKLRPSMNKNASVVDVSFESKSQATATQCLNTILNYVNAKQSALAEPVIAIKKAQLAVFQERLKEAEKLKNELDTRLSNLSPSSDLSAVLTSAVVTNQEIKNLITEISNLQIALDPSHTRPASFAAPIHVRDILTPLKRSLIPPATTLVGLLVGVILLLMRNAWRKAKNK